MNAMWNEWVDVVAMAARNPNSFKKPSSAELASIEKGCTVKICNTYERFFVCVTDKLPNGFFLGLIDNHLIGDYGYNYGDRVIFHENHVYVVHTRVYHQQMAEKLSLSQVLYMLADVKSTRQDFNDNK